jgi:NAD(P)-dependent dehydrogenase (short-subunit alcohol dehydrogenase family)
MENAQESKPSIALITGASRGLGRAMALALAERGTDIIATYQSKKEAALSLVGEVQKLGRKAAALELDVGRSDTFGAFVESTKLELGKTFGRTTIDALVNNAGHGAYASFEQTTEADFDQLVNVHIKGAYFLTQRLLPLLADGSSIVNISSGLARFSLPGYSAYAAVKGAVEVLTRYQALELGARGIRVNVLAPGAIETDFGGGVVRDNPALNQMIASQTALGRVGLPEDIGGALALLLDRRNGWVNGQRLEVSGGIHL